MTDTNIGSGGNASERIRSILVLVATLGTIAFNWMSAVGYVSGVTPEQISDKYPTMVTPAGYAFAIWRLIYLGLSAFSLYQLLSSQVERFRPVRSLYIVSCVLNCVWIYFWHAEAISVCLAVILGLWLVLLLIVARLAGFRSSPEIFLVQAPFGIYFGWVTAASLVNFAVMLTYLGNMPSRTSAAIVGSVLIVLSAVVAILVRIKFRNFFFPLAVAWAATAIAVKQSSQTMIVVAAAIAVVVCLIASLSFVMNLNSSSNE